MGAARSVVVALVVACAGCAPTLTAAYRDGLAAGDRAHSAGRDLDAAEAYDHAARDATRGLDRDEARYRAAQAWRRAGNTEAALQRFDELAAQSPTGERGLRSALEAAHVRQRAGETARAERELRALMERAPESGPGRRAIDYVLLARDAQDPSGELGLRWVAEAMPAFVHTELYATLRHEHARRLDRLGRTEEALASYEALLAVPYPRNTHWDDGGLEYVRLLVRLERGARAVAVADRVLGAREVSVLRPGSYERPHFADVAMERARALRDLVHDGRAAAAAFHSIYSDFPASRLRDDALAAEVDVHRSLGEADRACDVLRTLVREFPCTRWSRHAYEQRGACAGIDPPSGTRCRASSSPPSSSEASEEP